MSLPSYAIFLKDNKEIKRCFINCGWVLNVEITLNQIIKYVEENQFDFDEVIAYGTRYSNDLELELLKETELYLQFCELLEARRNRVLKQRGNNKVKFTMPTVQRAMPNLIAEEIVDVQPMSDSNCKLFSVKVSTEDV